jgi:hypothetical protein
MHTRNYTSLTSMGWGLRWSSMCTNKDARCTHAHIADQYGLGLALV